MRENTLAYGGKSRNLADAISKGLDVELPKPQFPVQALRLLNAYEFSMKIIGLNEKREEIYKKVFDSDGYGSFNFKIPLDETRKDIVALQLYEVCRQPGMDLHLGTYIPLRVNAPKKLAICDFDKTLVDTKYSTTKELYYSLTQPIEYFPTVTNTVDILKGYIKQGFHPFILSASPHFYEDAMRDWLYKNNIFSAGIFLKDYRQVFSIFEEGLTPKDLKAQGLYKMNHLLDILLMTGIPDDLILFGDNFESDPLIYLTLAKLLKENIEPWELWKSVKHHKAFQMNRKQDSQLLNKFYQLHSLIKKMKANDKEVKLKIYIRKKVKEDSIAVAAQFEKLMPLVELYDGLPPEVAISETAELLKK